LVAPPLAASSIIATISVLLLYFTIIIHNISLF
jgi:hypothetical protein